MRRDCDQCCYLGRRKGIIKAGSQRGVGEGGRASLCAAMDPPHNKACVCVRERERVQSTFHTLLVKTANRNCVESHTNFKVACYIKISENYFFFFLPGLFRLKYGKLTVPRYRMERDMKWKAYSLTPPPYPTHPTSPASMRVRSEEQQHSPPT